MYKDAVLKRKQQLVYCLQGTGRYCKDIERWRGGKTYEEMYTKYEEHLK